MLVKLFGGLVAVSALSLVGIQALTWATRATPESLGQEALSGTDAAARQQAALILAQQGKGSVTSMRQVLAESSEPEVRCAMIDGLAAQRDWDSMPIILDALTDDDARVRGRAAAACNVFFGIDFQLRPDGDPRRRAQIIESIRQAYEIHLHPPEVQEAGE
ncbi:MAG: HEAT repeat domain-containing protein [Gemmataceae bacterium]